MISQRSCDFLIVVAKLLIAYLFATTETLMWKQVFHSSLQGRVQIKTESFLFSDKNFFLFFSLLAFLWDRLIDQSSVWWWTHSTTRNPLIAWCATELGYLADSMSKLVDTDAAIHENLLYMIDRQVVLRVYHLSVQWPQTWQFIDPLNSVTCPITPDVNWRAPSTKHHCDVASSASTKLNEATRERAIVLLIRGRFYDVINVLLLIFLVLFRQERGS